MAFSQTLFMLILALHVSITMGIEAISNSTINTISKPGCPSNCGNASIPYPFGIGRGCYRDKAFEIICDGNTSNKPYLGYISREVLHLSLKELRVRSQITKLCYNSSTGMINSTSFNESTNLGYDLPSDGPFTYSTTHNKFTALGCDIFAFISYYNGDKLSGCASMCPAFGNIDIYNSSCLGVGCCSVAIPGGVKEFQVQAYSVNTQSRSWVSNTQACSYASIHDGEDKCKYISKHECGKHSECYDPDNSTLGYRCRCCQGFDGNPYLPNGCTDIDECKNGEATCAKEPSHNFSTTGRKFGAVCVNTPGSYICKCPDGTIGDGRREGVGCIPGHQFDYVRRRPTVLIVSIGC
ncbi:hypothetical protein Scep_026791 [Stephania cephalantha]|uniref:EGF-like calcium-binding domain-containing protein n=1 Tax=Stephania cephalantha TaxID=152367 RepID=A0AAP0HSC6_9MAGN